MFYFLAALFAMTFQVVALQTVWQTVWQASFIARSGLAESNYGEGGPPWSANWVRLMAYYDDAKVNQVTFVVAVVLLFVVVLAVLSTRSEQTQLKAGACLFYHELAELFGAPNKPERALRLTACGWIHLVRVSLLWCPARRPSSSSARVGESMGHVPARRLLRHHDAAAGRAAARDPWARSPTRRGGIVEAPGRYLGRPREPHPELPGALLHI